MSKLVPPLKGETKSSSGRVVHTKVEKKSTHLIEHACRKDFKLFLKRDKIGGE
jgi:hypothetical protein